MRKASVIAFLSIILLIGSSIYYYLQTYGWQISSQANTLEKMLTVCNHQMGQVIQRLVVNTELFYPVSGIGDHYHIAFSLPVNSFTASIQGNAFIVAAIALLIIMLIVLFYSIHLHHQNIEKKRIKQSKQALNKVLLYLPTSIILLDNNDIVSVINKSAIKLFELEDAYLIKGQKIEERQLFKRFRVINKKRISAQGTRYILIDANQKERVIYKEKIPFYNQSEKYTIESYHELTPFVKQQSSSLSPQQTEFIANISHELRTPLHGIIGMTDLLLGSSQLSDQNKEMTTVAKRSAETLLSLINDILDFSKLEAGRFEIESIPFNLKKEIHLVINDIIPLAKEKKISITTNFKDLLPADFIGDPIRIKQVIANLLNNAIKFTPHGNIIISAATGKTVNGGPAIRFSIIDSGIGINPDKLIKIFEPFSQDDNTPSRQHGGTGLGTTICKQLIQLMGGEIWAISPTGRSDDPNLPGTEICFTLPLKTKRHPKNLDFSKIYSYRQIKALIITDDLIHVQTLTRNLISIGLDFKNAPPTTETIEMLKNSNQFHLLIVDHRFDLNGLEFLQELHNHQLHQNYLILLQSNDYHATNTSLAHRLGTDIYLRKPIPVSILKNVINRSFAHLSEKEKIKPLSIPEEINILLIEANHLNQKMAINILNKLGYNSILAPYQEKAIQIFQEKQIHLVLLDEFLSFDETINLIRTLKEIGPQCPIIMTQQKEINQKIYQQYTEAGVADFLLKPIHLESVYQIILKWGFDQLPEG